MPEIPCPVNRAERQGFRGGVLPSKSPVPTKIIKKLILLVNSLQISVV